MPSTARRRARWQGASFPRGRWHALPAGRALAHVRVVPPRLVAVVPPAGVSRRGGGCAAVLLYVSDWRLLHHDRCCVVRVWVTPRAPRSPRSPRAAPVGITKAEADAH